MWRSSGGRTGASDGWSGFFRVFSSTAGRSRSSVTGRTYCSTCSMSAAEVSSFMIRSMAASRTRSTGSSKRLSSGETTCGSVSASTVGCSGGLSSLSESDLRPWIRLNFCSALSMFRSRADDVSACSSCSAKLAGLSSGAAASCCDVAAASSAAAPRSGRPRYVLPPSGPCSSLSSGILMEGSSCFSSRLCCSAASTGRAAGICRVGDGAKNAAFGAACGLPLAALGLTCVASEARLVLATRCRLEAA